MLSMLVVLLVFAGVAYQAMRPDERIRVLRYLLSLIHEIKDVVDRWRAAPDPFRDALRARTRVAVVTPALVAANVVVFLLILLGDLPSTDPDALIAWGANFAPRTTNGEWWRLIASTFVHARLSHLLINIVGLLQAGLILERLIGRNAVVAGYVVAGVCAGVVSLAMHPLDAVVGATAAVAGLYGVLLATWFWGLVDRGPAAIPLVALKRAAPAALVFLLFVYAGGGGVEPRALSAALAAGLGCGLWLAKGASDRKPPVARAGALAAVAAIVLVVGAPLPRVVDIRPEIARLLEAEDRIAGEYETVVDRFKAGRMSTDALAQVIDRTITPQLVEATARLEAIDGVPAAHQPIMDTAKEYVRLRQESWRLRADALRKGSVRTLQKADSVERASLAALERVQLPAK